MKTRFKVLLLGCVSIFVSTATLAHGNGYGGVYVGNGLSGGVSIWGGSHGRVAYAGNLNYVAGYAYQPAPYYGPVHGPQCGHPQAYGYNRSYKHGYRHGRRHGHHGGRRDHHGHRNHH